MESQTADYSGPVGQEVFGWTHKPTEKVQKETGVVLCYPLGHEYTHLHRWYRHWAHHLSQSGFVTARFDYRGTGNSSGDPVRDSELSDGLESWLVDIEAQCKKLRTQGCRKIALGGVRFGATLACLATARLPVEQLILINPCLKGRSYARELRALHALSGVSPSSSEIFQCAGHPLSRSTLEAISSVDLFQQPGLANIPTLLIQPDSDNQQDTESHLPDWAQSADKLGISAYQQMIDAPHNNCIPATTLADICRWMEQQAEDAVGNSQIQTLEKASHPGNPTRPGKPPDWQEQALWISVKPALFGVFNSPVVHQQTSHIALLLNAGSAHHAGPNRLYQELAGHLAVSGVASLRFDLENLGDSAIIGADNENHPYPDSAGANIELVLEWVKKIAPASKVSLVGLCAGAHATFHCALNNLPADNYVMINPLAFYWDPSMSLDIPGQLETDMEAAYLSTAMGSSRKWLKLLRGKVNLVHLLKFVARYSAQWARDSIGTLQRLFDRSTISRLEKDLGQLLDEGRKLHFVFSHRDPGLTLLSRGAGPLLRSRKFKTQVSMNTIAAADHTFTNAESRRQLAEILAQILSP